METLEKKHVEYKYNADELMVMILEFIDDVEKQITDKNYTLSEDSRKSLDKMKKVKSFISKGTDWKAYLGRLSKKGRKKINKYVARYNRKKSLHSINLFFHFLHTRVLADRELVTPYPKWYPNYKVTKFTSPDWITKVKVNPSQKHLDIQEKRKKWKEAQAVAEKLLAEYKEEKGDYYKKGGY